MLHSTPAEHRACEPDRRSPPSAGPLDRYHVLDLSTLVAGPFCAAILGDEGAEVVKLERQGALDTSRKLGQQPKMDCSSMGAMFMALNRNKRSLLIDANKPGADELLRDLAAWADVVVADADPACPLPYEVCKKANPRAVYVRIEK